MNEEQRNEITRSNPALVIFTLDISGSMSEKIFFRNKTMTKCDAMSQIVNLTITEIVDKCCFGTEYRDYFNLVVLGYDGTGVDSLLAKHSRELKEYVTINDLVGADIEHVTYNNLVVIEGVEKYVTLSARKYIDIKNPFHTTPMYGALSRAYEIAKKWTNERSSTSMPPIFINITDGEASDATDEELMEIAHKIKSISTSRGEALLVNVHIATDDHNTVLFPLSSNGLKDIKFANLLYEMSSELSEDMSSKISLLANVSWQKGERLRAMGYNTSISQLFNILQIGSISMGD